MDIKSLFTNNEPLAIITELKKRSTEQPTIAEYLKQWDPKQHAIFDQTERQDKVIKNQRTSTINGQPEEYIERIEKIARVAVAVQKLITKRSVAFIFGRPVKLTTPSLDDNQKKVLMAIEKIFDANKINSFNRKAARSLFKSTEVAEYWYTLDSDKTVNHTLTTKKKFKCAIFAPDLGDTLYPLLAEVVGSGAPVLYLDSRYSRYLNREGLLIATDMAEKAVAAASSGSKKA